MKSLIQKLVEAVGPSGYETQVRELVMEEVKDYVDSWKVDPLGNLITRKSKKGKDGLTIMLAAHLDEIGLMVTHVDDNGYARFTQLGFLFPINVTAGRVQFLNGPKGVIGLDASNDSIYKTDGLNKMFIDLGVDNKADCPVGIGDVAAMTRRFEDFGDRLVSKSMDDRIGVAVLIETLKQLKNTPHEVVGVFTVQEEVGTRGATPAAYDVDPDIAIAIDVCPTGDTPKSKTNQIKLGNGPAIKIRDAGMLADPAVIAWMEAGAKQAKLPSQREILLRGSTDARAMQLVRGGVPAGCVSIPCRYVHSPSEMVDYNDVQNAVKLLVHLLSKPVKL